MALKVDNNAILTPSSSTTDRKTKNKGVIGAIIASKVVSDCMDGLNTGVIGLMQKVSQVSQKDSVELSNAAQKALEQTGLKDKGVKIYTVPELKGNGNVFENIVRRFKNEVPTLSREEIFGGENTEPFGAVVEDIKSNKLIRKIAESKIISNSQGTENFYEYLAEKQYAPLKVGVNAGYFMNANKILIPDKHLQPSVFHEMGHAKNANSGLFLKTLQKIRPAAIKWLPGAILLISILNKRPKKSEDEKYANRTKLQKAADFIKDHAGILTFGSMGFAIAEEGIASLRGQKIAKSLVEDGSLSKELFKKIKKTNLVGFSSYIIGALGACLVCEAAIKVKDKIQQKYETKLRMEYHQG